MRKDTQQSEKMDVERVCNPLLALSDAKINTISSPNVASLTAADKVINTKSDSTQVEGENTDEELLKGLLADDYCHVCDAVLLFKSQRLSHYEGKKHSQKLRVYLQARRAEKINKDPTRLQTMTTDKDCFCELCNMVFSSPVVARSHYTGKVHAKNLGKKGRKPTVAAPYKEMSTPTSLPQDPDNPDQNSTADGDEEQHPGPTTARTNPSTEIDLKDLSKYCPLCAAYFSNPQMAFQHYNGRKHQRNKAKQELLRELGDEIQPANSLMCHMCCVQFNSVEMYQAHMQGNKHQIREKKVIDLCKSQQKEYSTFADELSDYIQVQRARGITPKTPQVLPSGDKQKEDEDEENVDEINEMDILGQSKQMPNLSRSFNIPQHSQPGWYNQGERWVPPYRGPQSPSHGWHYNCPGLVFSGSRSETFTKWPVKRRRHRKQSSSSSYNSSSSSSSSSTSSYSSSESSSVSDSDDTKHRPREKRRIQRCRRERDKRAKHPDSDKSEKRRKQAREDRSKESQKRRREESGDSEEERMHKKLKGHGKQGKWKKESQEKDLRFEEVKSVEARLMTEHTPDNTTEKEVHNITNMNVEQGDVREVKPKYRKEKRKTKERADNRTEDEKLWDDSILGF
ncbi:zinc finger matrin-type protein 1 isoform X2 [Halichoeres trimaculatus]|uniref:zinc finger matrin-type protein 1 isoform X2 n=1 Tax=Halichoeres trimaculatus TaxID=147232 RepID=UPI003D9E6EA6